MASDTNTKDVKTYVKTNSLRNEFIRNDRLLKILQHVQQGFTRPDIQTALKLPNKQDLTPYLTYLLKNSLIIKPYDSKPAKYQLTNLGKDILIQHEKTAESYIELHNIIWKYPIFKEGNIRPTKTWTAKGTVFKLLEVENCSIRWGGRSLTVAISNIKADTGHKAHDIARSKVENVVNMLKKDFGFELGQSELVREPHFAIVNPITREIAKHVQITKEEYDINKSQSGEVELKGKDVGLTAEKVDRFVTGMNELPQAFLQIQDVLVEYTKQMALHLEVQRETKTALVDMKETLKAIRDKLS